MKTPLLKHKPSDISAEEFKKTWENIGYSLQALRKAIEEEMKQNSEVGPADFDCPNHYAKLAYQAGQNRGYAYVLSLLPETSKP